MVTAHWLFDSIGAGRPLPEQGYAPPDATSREEWEARLVAPTPEVALAKRPAAAAAEAEGGKKRRLADVAARLRSSAGLPVTSSQAAAGGRSAVPSRSAGARRGGALSRLLGDSSSEEQEGLGDSGAAAVAGAAGQGQVRMFVGCSAAVSGSDASFPSFPVLGRLDCADSGLPITPAPLGPEAGQSRGSCWGNPQHPGGQDQALRTSCDGVGPCLRHNRRRGV